jgi:hypothetical protein
MISRSFKKVSIRFDSPLIMIVFDVDVDVVVDVDADDDRFL